MVIGSPFHLLSRLLLFLAPAASPFPFACLGFLSLFRVFSFTGLHSLPSPSLVAFPVSFPLCIFACTFSLAVPVGLLSRPVSYLPCVRVIASLAVVSSSTLFVSNSSCVRELVRRGLFLPPPLSCRCAVLLGRPALLGSSAFAVAWLPGPVGLRLPLSPLRFAVPRCVWSVLRWCRAVPRHRAAGLG
ncbi:hypothetical protein Tco_0340496 [Tanacetum coccineum]|uniref:Transmembrane protein n=1 Tax=Tanacetum coccineum TaxID=301880 RepID=A0ABQ5H7D6_9ASTR